MKNALLLLASLLISVGLGEVALRVFTDFPVSTVSNKTDDSRLGYRLSPASREVDANGFRNDGGKADSYVVAAIGDSHTFGNNVRSADAWPAVFERLSGVPTYNFGVGSYGIFSYHVLVRDAIDRPSGGVILGLYPANDFAESFNYCQAAEPDFRYWSDEIARLGLSAPAMREACVGDGGNRDGLASIEDFLRNRSATVSAVEYLVVDRIRNNFARARAASGEKTDDRFYFPDGIPSIEKDRVRKHSAGLDKPSKARMLDNFRKMAADWRNLSDETGVPVGILIIPSRERVVYALLERRGLLDQADPQFREWAGTQVRLEKAVADMIGEIGFPLADATAKVTEAFDAAVGAGRDFYPQLDDGHPYEDGYRAYAEMAVALWDAMKGR
jgi:hypothetical protein